MILTRPLPGNDFLAATANPQLETTRGDAFGAMTGADGLTDLVMRQGRIRGANTTVEVVREPNGMTTLREVPREGQVPADTLKQRYPWVDYDRPMTDEAARIIADAKKAQMVRDDIVARSNSIVAPLAGSLVAMATDPLEVASAFIPIVGPGSRALMVGRLGRVGGRIAEGVVEGAVGNALTEPLYYGLSRSQRLDYDMGDALMNVGLGGALGGLLGTGAAVAGRVWREPGVARVAPAESAPVSVAAMRGYAEGDPRADMTPPQRMAAMRTAVAQVAYGRPVDIPLPKRPTTTLQALRAIGIRDDAGDLAAMGVRDWDRQSRFSRNVVRDDGMGRDEAARWLWQRGYLRDQPEAQQMRLAEQGQGPEPDLVAAMDRAIDDELRGSPRYAEGQEPVISGLREQVERRVEMREALGPTASGLRDNVIDDVIERVDQGQAPRDALQGALGFNPTRQPDIDEDAAASVQVAEVTAVDPLADIGPSGRLTDDGAQAALDREAHAVDVEEDDLYSARMEDLRNRGFLSDDDIRFMEEEADMAFVRAGAVRDVMRAAATCAISVPF